MARTRRTRKQINRTPQELEAQVNAEKSNPDTAVPDPKPNRPLHLTMLPHESAEDWRNRLHNAGIGRKCQGCDAVRPMARIECLCGIALFDFADYRGSEPTEPDPSSSRKLSSAEQETGTHEGCVYQEYTEDGTLKDPADSDR